MTNTTSNWYPEGDTPPVMASMLGEKSSKMAIEAIKITRLRSKVHIEAPFNETFIEKVKQIGGKWRWKIKVWSIPELAYPLLQNICLGSYKVKLDSRCISRIYPIPGRKL